MHSFRTVTETQIKWNSFIKQCELVKVEDGVNIVLTITKPPVVFISGRILIDGMYTYEYPEKNEYIVAFSSKGNEEIMSDYRKTHSDANKYEIARSIISGHWFKPIYSQLNEKEVIGTRYFYLNQVDFGGKVPQWIRTTFAPKAILDSFEGLAKFSKTNPL